MTGKTKPETRPATAADLLAFFGQASPVSVRAQVMTIDGAVVGVAGYYIANGVAVVFSDAKDGIPKMAIWRAAKAFMADFKLPAICVAEENSGPFLERLGWVHVGPSEAGEVYQWQR